MARYEKQREQIFVVGGRDDEGELVLIDENSGQAYVRNPSTTRRPKKEYIELPMGQFEDLRVRLGLVRSSKRGKFPAVQIGASADVAALMEPFSREPQEIISVLLLDVRNVVLGIHEVHKGGLSSASVEPAAVFRAAVIANASAIIVVHNHPSGVALQSKEDEALALLLLKCAELLGLRMHDFIVIGHRDYVSFSDKGLL